MLAAQAAALKTAQSLQGISTDPSARPDDSAIASTAPRPQSAEAGTARAVDAGSTTPSSEDADSSVWLRLWRSTKKALQPVLTSGLQRFGKRSASTAKEGVAQAAVLDAPTGHEVMYKQQTANQEKFSQGLHNTSHSDRDEWGRLVLHVNGAAGSSNGMGNIVPLVEQVPSAREDVSSPNTILWVRQEPDDQQEQQLPLQNQEQRSGPANGAVHHAQHQNGSERNNRPSQEPPRIRLRHRRFSGKEISREALLDNVE